MSDDIASLRRILGRYRQVAVVGLSANWYRPSYFAAKYLVEHGFHITPVNPNYAEILGLRCYPRLIDIPHPIEVVDLFQRSELVPPFVDDAIRIGAKVVWMQIGVMNEPAAARARAAGLEVVMNRCMKIEYARLFGGLNFVGVNTGVVSSRRPEYRPK